MRISEFKSLASGPHLHNVNFVESSCGPMVIEVEVSQGEQVKRELLRDHKGEVVTCSCITKAYDLCTQAGVHKANLVQVIPHDEACMGAYAEYHRDAIALKF